MRIKRSVALHFVRANKEGCSKAATFTYMIICIVGANPFYVFGFLFVELSPRVGIFPRLRPILYFILFKKFNIWNYFER